MTTQKILKTNLALLPLLPSMTLEPERSPAPKKTPPSRKNNENLE